MLTDNHPAFMPFISPGTAQRLLRRGIGHHAAFQWFHDPVNKLTVLRNYAMSEQPELEAQDHAVAQVNQCIWLPAYSSDELLRICPDNLTITRLQQKGAVSYRVANGLDVVTGPRLPDQLAEIIIRFLGRNPQHLVLFNKILQNAQPLNPISNG